MLERKQLLCRLDGMVAELVCLIPTFGSLVDNSLKDLTMDF